MNQAEVRRRQIQLCSLCLGLLTIRIIGNRIGDLGVTYLVAAMEAFALLWTLVGRPVPDTLGKMLRVRVAKGQYKNADKMRRSLIGFQAIMGVLCAICLVALAGVVSEKVYELPYTKFLIMMLAPVIVIRVINEVLLGIFQGDGSELPSAVSSLLRQVLILLFGILFAKMLSGYGEKVSKLLGQETFVAMYGCVGVMIAMLIAEGIVLLFLLVVYRSASKNRKKKDVEGMRSTDSVVGQVYALYSAMGIPILIGLLELLPLWIGFLYYRKITAEVAGAIEIYGIYIGKYMVICGIAFALLAALILPVAAKCAIMVRKDEQRYAKNVFMSGIKSIVVFALFFSVYIFVMAGQFAGAISSVNPELLTRMLECGSWLVFFGVLSYYGLHLMRMIGKKYLIIGCLAIADIVYVVSISLFLKNTNSGGMALVYAGVLGVGVLAVVSCGFMFQYLHGGIDFLRVFIIPGLSICVSGLVGLLLGKALTPHLGNVVTLVVVLVLAMVLHLALVVFLRTFREQETEVVPLGRILRAIGQMLGVF